MRHSAAHIQIVRHGDRTYHYARIPTPAGERRTRLSDDYEEALHQCGALKTEGLLTASHDAHLPHLLYAAKQRALGKGRSFELTMPDLRSMLYRQRDRCAVCFIPFSMQQTAGTEDKFCRPFAPSIDRIDPAGGYTLDNVRLAARIVNFSMNKWGAEAFLAVARAVAEGTKNGRDLQTTLLSLKTSQP